MGSWDKAKLHLSETVFMLVFSVSLLENMVIFFFFMVSLLAQYVKLKLEFVQQPAFCAVTLLLFFLTTDQ